MPRLFALAKRIPDQRKEEEVVLTQANSRVSYSIDTILPGGQQGKKYAWSHVLGGWFLDNDIKAAHLVPKNLGSNELSHRFGVGELPRMDPRNDVLVSS